MTVLRLIVRLLRPHAGWVVTVLVLQVIQVWGSLSLPRLNATIIDDGITRGDTAVITTTGMTMLGFVLIQVLAQTGALLLAIRISLSVGRDLRAEVFARVSAFSQQDVSRFGSSSLLTRTTNDVQPIEQLVLMGSSTLVSAPLLFIGGIALAVGEDGILSLVLVGAVPLMLVPLVLIFRRLVPLFARAQAVYDRMTAVVSEQLTGVRVIRAFTREPAETARFARVNDEMLAVGRLQGRLDTLISPVINTVFAVTFVVMMGLGAVRVMDGSLQIGQLTAFTGYLTQILFGLLMASFTAMMLPRSLVSAQRISEVLAATPSITAPEFPAIGVPIRGEVAFRRVGFAYPGAEQSVLRDVSFTARPGTMTAIVGSTGSGKTTLVSLLLRLFDVTEGSVLVDGVDVRDLDPEDLWGRIGYVPQRAYLFAGTVADNLRYGNPDATEEDLWAALRIAQARDFVASLPEGLDASVEQGGANLSGGQRQRLAIARAVIKRPPIYAFDDSFSALDTATDARLRRELARELDTATIVLVAQRVSTILDADQIVVLDHGEIVGAGTHQRLLTTCPTYAEIVTSQLAAEDAA